MPNRFQVFKERSLPKKPLLDSVYFVAPEMNPEIVEIYVTSSKEPITVKKAGYLEPPPSARDMGSGENVVDNTLPRVKLYRKEVNTSVPLTFSPPLEEYHEFSMLITLTEGGSIVWPTNINWGLGETSPSLHSGNHLLEFLTVDRGISWYMKFWKSF